jgi:tetratricopeptide (TPR) repeat protein
VHFKVREALPNQLETGKIVLHVRTLVCILLALHLAAYAGDSPASVPVATTVTAKDRKAAKHAFSRALKLRAEGKSEEAYELFQRAASLDPASPEYLTAREVARQQMVFDHLQQGNGEMLAGKQIEALAEFRSALNLDDSNQFAKQRLRDALSEWAPPAAGTQPRVLAQAGTIEVQPHSGRRDFRFRGDSRTLLEQVAGAYGLTATVDESVVPHHVSFDIDNVDFPTAMQAAG